MLEFIIGFGIFATLFLTVLLVIGQVKKVKSQRILSKLSMSNFNTGEIDCLIQRSSRYNATGGVSTRATIYFNDDLILLVSVGNRIRSALFLPTLPIIFTAKVEEAFNQLKTYDIVNPRKISLNSFGNLIVEYQASVKPEINMRIEVKFDSSKQGELMSALKERSNLLSLHMKRA